MKWAWLNQALNDRIRQSNGINKERVSKALADQQG